LTEQERELIKQHSTYSSKLLSSLSDIPEIVDDVKHHHEKYDGTGYPDAYHGAAIPLGARILAVADSFDAMQSDRPYRKSLDVEEAVKELSHCSGTQFDPEIVNVFLQHLPIQPTAVSAQ
jgi:HD-GYP domain-containing protein (c-di-GMP phosphodiesterase class II)